MSKEKTLLKIHKATQRNIAFIIFCIVLVPFLGAGLIGLAALWLQHRTSTLTFTNKRIKYRTGILAKHTSDVYLEDVRNVQISATFYQRLCGVGGLSILTAGHGGVEICADWIARPFEYKEWLDELISQSRQDATTNLIGVCSE